MKSRSKPSIPSLAELAASRAQLKQQVTHSKELAAKTRKRHPLLLLAGATVSGCAYLAGGPQWLMWIALPLMLVIVALLELALRVQDVKLEASVAEAIDAITDLEAMHKGK